jgi:FkbM family methyltransferase
MHTRSLWTIFSSVFQRRHWTALANTFIVTETPLRHLFDYLTRRRSGFPRNVGLRTPIGRVQARLSTADDLLTVNEIFCRLDYEVPNDISIVVDFGANIGISALYFLSRNTSSRVWLFEPNPYNVEKLKVQMADYADRVKICPIGVAPDDGVLKFGFEPTGRYGGAGLDLPEKMDVEVRSANKVLLEILEEHQTIDVLKIDIESLEDEILNSLSTHVLSKIRLIVIEGCRTPGNLAASHEIEQYGPITRLTLRE